jgi:hypothetical protein
MAEFLLEEMQRRLVEFGDRMPGVLPDRRREPVEWWWEYQPGFWISYVLRYERSFWRRRLRMIIVSVGDDPPAQVASSSLRS